MENFEAITSKENARLIDLRKIRDGKDRSRIFVEGTRLVDDALASGVRFDACFVTEKMWASDLCSRLRSHGVSVSVVADKIFPSIADTSSPQGIVAAASRPISTLSAIETALSNPESLPLVVFLNEINNPANLGAVVRVAAASGAGGVIVSTKSADAFSPKALRASMGSAFRIAIVENADIETVCSWAEARGLITTATHVSASSSYIDTDWLRPRLLIFGSEANGLSDAEIGMVKQTISIPMNREVESLNLAVSAGIVLFEAKRQIGLAVGV